MEHGHRGSRERRAGGVSWRMGSDRMETMKAFEERIIIDRNLINHPVKSNTYQP